MKLILEKDFVEQELNNDHLLNVDELDSEFTINEVCKKGVKAEVSII